MPYDLSIVGTAGLPAAYGGFETLAEQLAQRLSTRRMLQVFCTGKARDKHAHRPSRCEGADLRYVAWDANGWQSIVYDFISLWVGAPKSRTLLVLGVSGCLLLPVVRLLWPRTRIVTNIDGLEWKRRKWGPVARTVLRMSEWAAVRFSHAVIADNQGIHEHVQRAYGREAELIAYGGDQGGGAAVLQGPSTDTRFQAGDYYLTVCRIEPENNIVEILEAFAAAPKQRVVIVGNWAASKFASSTRAKFADLENIELKDPIYDRARLDSLRSGAKACVHGHSAGGTNPSLVEAMSFGMAVLAFDVNYNRYTTNNDAAYWKTSADLARQVTSATAESLRQNAMSMKECAARQYTWRLVVTQYEKTLFPGE